MFPFKEVTLKCKIRHPQDVYDRVWTGEIVGNGLHQIANTAAVDELIRNSGSYKVPGEVLMTAEETINRTYYWYRYWKSPNATYKWYLYFHFAEIQILQSNQTRAFGIYVQGSIVRTVFPVYLKPVTVESLPVSGSQIIYNISATTDANLPPFSNAVEIYYGVDLTNSQTDLDDCKLQIKQEMLHLY